MKCLVTAVAIATLTNTLAAAPPPAPQFRTIVTTADNQPLVGVAQVIAENGGAIVAVVAPDNSFDSLLVQHPGNTPGTAAQTLLSTDDQLTYFGAAAVNNSPSLGRLVTVSAYEGTAGGLLQHRIATAETRRLHDPAAHGDYLLTPFDTNAAGQAIYTAYNAGAGEAVRAIMTAASLTRDVEDRYLDLFNAFPHYLAPNGTAYIINHPPAGPERELWASAMNPAVAPDVLVSPGLSVNGQVTNPFRILGGNDNQVLFTALAAAPGGNDNVYLRTDNAGLVAYEPLYSAPTIGEDFHAVGLLTPGGRASLGVADGQQTHLRYWDGTTRHDWTFPAAEASIQMSAPMIGDGGDWIVFYATLPPADELLPPSSAIFAWNPVMDIDPFVLLQTGGQIDLAGEGLITIADLQLMGLDGLYKDALSDNNDLAVAFRRSGSDFFEIATVALPVPEPAASGAILFASALFLRRRRNSARAA